MLCRVPHDPKTTRLALTRTIIAFCLVADFLAASLPSSAETTGSATTSADAQSSFFDRFLPRDEIFDLNGVRTWATAYGGRSSLAGSTAQNTQSVTASVFGTVLGADKQIDDLTLLGASLGLSHQTFSSDSGTGRSDDTAVTLYGRRTFFDAAYISLALGYGWHAVSTDRPITSLGTLSYNASYHAHDIGGRIEGGYSLAFDEKSSLAPFLAFVGDAYNAPAYSETGSNGRSNLAVSYFPSAIGITHTELGARYFRYFTLDDGWYISLDTVAAWERELDDTPLILAAFETSPGSDFALHGMRPARDTALAGLGLRLQTDNGFTFGVRSDARLGVGTTIFSGTADITYRW
jgi:uncharacterized protein with beta-barrel porin domain